MSNVITSKFKFQIAKNFKDSVASGTSQLYVYYGRPLPWDTPGTPNVTANTQAQITETWSNILALKKIYNNDVSLAFKRNDWTSGIVYDYYTDNGNLFDLTYFVINSTNEVFKCIDNNNGSASTVEPASLDPNSTQVEIVDTPDGYRWKYMFTIPTYLLRKFTSANYLPITSNRDVIASAVEGTIDKTEIIASGAGYPASSDLHIFQQGDGNTSDSATITIDSIGVNGEIDTFSFTNRGSGYKSGPGIVDVPVRIQQTFADVGNINNDINFESAYGVATINSFTGAISDLVITVPGKNYIQASAKIVQSSAYAKATTDTLGAVDSVTTIFKGAKFRECTSILVPATQGDFASVVTEAELNPIVSPFFGHGGNPEKELSIDSVIFSVYTIFDESGDFSVANDFRTVGVIIDPIDFALQRPSVKNTLNAKYTITINETNAQDFVSDEILGGAVSESEAILIDAIGDSTLRYLKKSNSTDFNVGEVIVGQDSNTQATIKSIIPPEVVPYSGEILLINNGISFQRNQGQLEATTFIISF